MVDTLKLYESLSVSFEPSAARTLAHVIAELVEELQEKAGRAELGALTDSVNQLAQAQQRTEERVEQLAQAQQRTEERIEQLAQAQQRTEERVEQLAQAQQRTEERIEQLAQAQQRTEERVEQLAQAQQRTEVKVDRLATELGNLSNRVGVTTEEEAASVLRVALERAGWTVLARERAIAINGEVDAAIEIADAEGRRACAVIEAKTRLAERAVEAWASRIRDDHFRAQLAEAGAPGPYLAYVYGMRYDLAAEEAAQRHGVGLVSSRGIVVEPAGEIP